MKGKEEEFDLFTEYRDREQAVFGTAEQINMENARKLLNFSLFVLGGAALLQVVSYCVFLGGKKKRELRGAFKGGILIFAILVVLLLPVVFKQTREALYNRSYQ
jgi:glucan phosphoethanolaminetransferase (alkaline phosphatase superfamily)